MEAEIIVAPPVANPDKSAPGPRKHTPRIAARPQRIITDAHKELIELRLRINILRIVWAAYKNPAVCLRVLKALDAKRRMVLGNGRLKKFATAGGLYFWDMYTPGWPSMTFDAYILGEAARIAPIAGKQTNRFTNIFVAITKKCPLQCEHCFEWDALNKKEVLTLPDLKNIVRSVQDKGTGLIQFTGGEPMLRIGDMIEVLHSARKDTQFWVLTSGFKFTAEAAQRLKGAGLTGVAVSLDHFDPEMHNAFRGFKNAYAWVEEAVKAAQAAGLIVALSECATRAFVTESNLVAYAELAKRLGVSFIQILEPKAVGHYKSKDVLLHAAQEQVIERFYLRMNYDRAFRDFPVVTYHGYHQRQIGCFGAGNRNLYIDTDGDLHACPFCQTKRGSALGGNLDEAIAALQAVGCHGFKGVEI